MKAWVSVAAHHLFFNDLDVGDYLTYCKVNPPFRSEDDRQALIAEAHALAVLLGRRQLGERRWRSLRRTPWLHARPVGVPEAMCG